MKKERKRKKKEIIIHSTGFVFRRSPVVANRFAMLVVHSSSPFTTVAAKKDPPTPSSAIAAQQQQQQAQHIETMQPLPFQQQPSGSTGSVTGVHSQLLSHSLTRPSGLDAILKDKIEFVEGSSTGILGAGMENKYPYINVPSTSDEVRGFLCWRLVFLKCFCFTSVHRRRPLQNPPRQHQTTHHQQNYHLNDLTLFFTTVLSICLGLYPTALLEVSSIQATPAFSTQFYNVSSIPPLYNIYSNSMDQILTNVILDFVHDAIALSHAFFKVVWAMDFACCAS